MFEPQIVQHLEKREKLEEACCEDRVWPFVARKKTTYGFKGKIIPGNASWGVVTSGVNYLYVMEALEILGLFNVPVFKIGMTSILDLNTDTSAVEMDIRVPAAAFEESQQKRKRKGVALTKGKVGKIEQNGAGLKLHVEDVENETILEAEHDLVVLATGMVPNAVDDDLAVFTRKDDDGFVLDDLGSSVTVAGVARRPEDVAASVRDATGAAARALVAAGRRA